MARAQADGGGLPLFTQMSAQHDPGDICEVCGCTEFDACRTPTGPCFWVSKGLCSACASDEDLALFAQQQPMPGKWQRPAEPRFRKVYA
jgi:hypothetical protein